MRRVWKRYLILVGAFGGVLFCLFLLTPSLPDPSDPKAAGHLSSQLSDLEHQIESQKKDSSLLLDRIRSKFGGQAEEAHQLNQDVEQGEVRSGGAHGPVVVLQDENGAHEELEDHSDSVIAVLVFVCNRPTVSRCLDKLLKYRPSPSRFPIIVSQDCGPESAATQALLPYADAFTHIFQPDQSPISVLPKDKKFIGYYKISRHYGWALNHTFNQLNYTNVIVVEDDIEVAPDFFDYFAGTLGLLKADPTLWCVSAWNDNGKPKRINGTAPELLHRTDFFPGLGWMLRKDLWNELGPKWPAGFWDDWMREPAQRRERACIRPEISRTSTFGKNGVSQGTYYLNHLRYIKLNDRFVPFTSMDMSYLLKENYDEEFVRRVYSRRLLGSVAELREVTDGLEDQEEFRLVYRTKADFRKIALQLEIMEDMKAGVPRTAYRGVVSFMFQNHRVYLAPGANWAGYSPN